MPSSVRLEFSNSPAKWMDSLIKENELMSKARADADVAKSVLEAVGDIVPAKQKGASAPVVAPFWGYGVVKSSR